MKQHCLVVGDGRSDEGNVEIPTAKGESGRARSPRSRSRQRKYGIEKGVRSSREGRRFILLPLTCRSTTAVAMRTPRRTSAVRAPATKVATKGRDKAMEAAS
jgi:hypothetical protein